MGIKLLLILTFQKNTISWSYYLGVDQSGEQAFKNATEELSKNAAPLLKLLPGYGPLAALALNGASYITKLSSGEDIDFYIVQGENVNNFINGSQFYYLKKGKVINDFSVMGKSRYLGSYHFCLSNDNAVKSVAVTVKVTT